MTRDQLESMRTECLAMREQLALLMEWREARVAELRERMKDNESELCTVNTRLIALLRESLKTE